MSRGRKNGCPVSLKDWVVRILDTSSDKYLRIFGLTSLTRSVDGETEDGSAEDDAWAEPFVKKRSGSLTLKGRPKVDPSTGERNPGQEELNTYAEQVGCDADATIELIDPYGHAVRMDVVVTNKEDGADDSGQTCSWDMEQVGEAEYLPYIQVSAVTLKDNTANVTELNLNVGDAPKLLNVAFTPENASNNRFKVSCSKKSVASISNVSEDGFSVSPIGAGTATITVTSVNGGKSATVTVTVT